MSTATRPTLLGRLREGHDAMAWEEFFACYWPTVFKYARHRGASDITAEEIVQDVMLKVFEHRDVFRYDPARGRFRDWLRRVTVNCLAECRRRPSERVRAVGGEPADERLETPDEQVAVDTAWEKAFEQSVLLAMLDVVRRESNPRDFMAFELTVLQHHSPAEVARLTGLTRNMVYKARRKIIARLRQLGSDYAADGRLRDELRDAMRSYPSATVERSLTDRVEQTMRGR